MRRTKKELAMDKCLTDAIKCWMVKRGITNEEVASARLGMSKSTFRRRMHEPRSFRVDELRLGFSVIGAPKTIYTDVFGKRED